MNPEVFDQSRNTILKMAHMYFIEGLPQKAIANRMSVSISTVSRSLLKARSEGYIHISIPEVYSSVIQIEKQLTSTFGLQEAIVIHTEKSILPESATESMHIIRKEVALEAARYIQRIVKPNDVLGVGWGIMPYHMINYLNPCRKTNTSFVSLHGSISEIAEELDVRNLTSRMSMAFGGKYYLLMAEALMSNSGVADLLRNEPNVKAIFDIFPKVTIAVNGIGELFPQATTLLASENYMSSCDLQNLRAAGAYGVINLRFFTHDGTECQTDLKDRTIGIDLETFKAIPQKIAIVTGVCKKEALLAALRGHLVDVLVLDETLAQEILK